ncbi:hypothetical protein CYMTET_24391 [Cymbomonas tetramitiformis]|uniref:Uncharacterized protein n=1 Tax=Cymbomonas tetramitiformis TaxID=36881 RepID=A0AAE0FW73_9CHLO|nr:hypothetical protein CYMTET_24391 [Cymbomonas tetramitiformis]
MGSVSTPPNGLQADRRASASTPSKGSESTPPQGFQAEPAEGLRWTLPKGFSVSNPPKGSVDSAGTLCPASPGGSVGLRWRGFQDPGWEGLCVTARKGSCGPRAEVTLCRPLGRRGSVSTPPKGFLVDHQGPV